MSSLIINLSLLGGIGSYVKKSLLGLNLSTCFTKVQGFIHQSSLFVFFGFSMRGILDSGIKKLETLSEFIQNYKTKGLFKLLALWVPGFFHREVEHLFSQVLGFDGETLETPGLATPTG